MTLRSSQPLRTRRLFTRRRSRLTTTLLALAAIVVTSCTEAPPAPPPPNYSDIKVEWVTMTHDVAFDGAAPTLTSAEMAGLDAFLDRSAVRLTDQIALQPASGADPALAQARAEALSKALWQRLPGIRVRLLDNGTGATSRVVLGRYVAVQPECAGWMTPEQRFAAFRNPENHADSNFGCATAKNLAATIADPGDLVHGRALTPTDGNTQARAIGLYQIGKSPHPHSTHRLQEVE